MNSISTPKTRPIPTGQTSEGRAIEPDAFSGGRLPDLNPGRTYFGQVVVATYPNTISMITPGLLWTRPENLENFRTAFEQALRYGASIVVNLGDAPLGNEHDRGDALGLLIEFRKRCHGMEGRMPLVLSESNDSLALVRRHPAFEIYPTPEQAAVALGVNRLWFEQQAPGPAAEGMTNAQESLKLRTIVVKIAPGSCAQQMKAFMKGLRETIFAKGLQEQAEVVTAWSEGGIVTVRCSEHAVAVFKEIEEVDGVITLSSPT